MCVCVCVIAYQRAEGSQAWADGPQRCYRTVSGHCDWCIATSKKVEHLAADPQSELIGPAFSLFSCCERADGWFGRNKHTHTHTHTHSEHSTFPPSREPGCMGCALENFSLASARRSRWWCRAGRTSARSHVGEQRRHSGAQGYCVTLGWRRSDLELILGGGAC